MGQGPGGRPDLHVALSAIDGGGVPANLASPRGRDRVSASKCAPMSAPLHRSYAQCVERRSGRACGSGMTPIMHAFRLHPCPFPDARAELQMGYDERRYPSEPLELCGRPDPGPLIDHTERAEHSAVRSDDGQPQVRPDGPIAHDREVPDTHVCTGVPDHQGAPGCGHSLREGIGNQEGRGGRQASASQQELPPATDHRNEDVGPACQLGREPRKASECPWAGGDPLTEHNHLFFTLAGWQGAWLQTIRISPRRCERSIAHDRSEERPSRPRARAAKRWGRTTVRQHACWLRSLGSTVFA